MCNREDGRRLSEASQIACSNGGGKFTSNINFHDKEGVMSMFQDNVDIKVADVPFIMSMSFVTGLTDLIEDEVIPKPIPLKVRLLVFRKLLQILIM